MRIRMVKYDYNDSFAAGAVQKGIGVTVTGKFGENCGFTVTKKDSAGDLEVTRLCVYVIADKTELSNYMAAQMEVEFMIAS